MYINSNYDLQLLSILVPTKSHRLLHTRLALFLAFETKNFLRTLHIADRILVAPTLSHRLGGSSLDIFVIEASKQNFFGFSPCDISFRIVSNWLRYRFWISLLNWHRYRFGYFCLSSYKSTWIDFSLVSITETCLYQHTAVTISSFPTTRILHSS
jgi:hypothetical protein